MNEKWKPIDGYNGLYEVSNIGRVRNSNGLVMKTRRREDGYVVVTLRKKPKYKIEYIHILVAKAFIPKPIGKTEVNHIDAVKSNNIVTNLEWVTRSENHFHAVKMGLKPINPIIGRKGKNNPLTKPIYQYDLQGTFIRKWDSCEEAAKFYNRHKTSIGNALNGHHKSSAGFIWKHVPPTS